MLEILELYKWTFVATPLMAMTLSWLGLHLISRHQSVQSLVVAQGSSFGIILGLTSSFLLFHDHSPNFSSSLTLGFGLGTSSLVYLWSERVRKTLRPSLINSYQLCTFVVLIALGYLVTALSPQLEAHMSSIYFGDLATMYDSEALIAILFSLASLSILTFNHRTWLNESFEIAILGKAKSSVFFTLIALVMICLSIQYLGLLFTLSSLFVAPTILAQSENSSFRAYLLKVLLASGLGASLGFLAAMAWPQLPTVPTLVVSLLLISLLFSLKNALRPRPQRL